MRHKRSNRAHKPKSKSGAKPSGLDQQVIYGRHAVLAALHNPARNIINLWATDNAAVRYSDDLKPYGDKLTIVKAAELDRMVVADAVHQGLVLKASPLPVIPLEQIIENTQDRLVLVVLDQITDPHNVGAIFRSCAAFGVNAVIMPARNSVEFSGVLAKAASGAIEHVPLVRVTNLARSLKMLQASHISVVGFDSELTDDFERVQDHNRIALIFGAEGKGMRRLTRENCDHLVHLKMPGVIKSLNVSNACAVALYALSMK